MKRMNSENIHKNTSANHFKELKFTCTEPCYILHGILSPPGGGIVPHMAYTEKCNFSEYRMFFYLVCFESFRVRVNLFPNYTYQLYLSFFCRYC